MKQVTSGFSVFSCCFHYSIHLIRIPISPSIFIRFIHKKIHFSNVFYRFSIEKCKNHIQQFLRKMKISRCYTWSNPYLNTLNVNHVSKESQLNKRVSNLSIYKRFQFNNNQRKIYKTAPIFYFIENNISIKFR